MNLSGASALAARVFYKVENTDLLVVCDDFNIPLGTLRLRGQGSAGGQKGLADILHRLGTDEVPRLRIGVGPVPASWDPIDFVLSRFTKDEKPEIELSLVRAADAVEAWATKGMAEAMNRFN
jgi:peptidyl-tRNA hydrolase, PTH1 family